MKRFVEPDRSVWSEIMRRPETNKQNLNQLVSEVFNDVLNKGDEGVGKYTELFDGVKIESTKVKLSEILDEDALASSLKKAIQQAAQNIEAFHKTQVNREPKVETMPGVECWRESRAINRVGLYIPGGSAPLFSTVLMLGIPANVAGCRDLVLCTPPSKKGRINQAILFAAKVVGVEYVYPIGGIQAIAAMTYGTDTVPRVDKIFGPGNQYVTAAKQYATIQGTAIDIPAGPSEVLVLADENANADFVAADLLAQAEHGGDSQVILVASTEEKLSETEEAIERQIKVLPRATIVRDALESCRLVCLKSEEDRLDFSNSYAPEHLIINTSNAEALCDRITNAGSVFIGAFTPESAGDYASGTNHTLPTNGYARNYSGVSVDSFVKKITFQKISEVGLQNLAPTVCTMAEAELLQAHSNAVKVRLS